MLAVTRPEIISDHVDLLLKIGLGPAGKVGFISLKYRNSFLSIFSNSVIWCLPNFRAWLFVASVAARRKSRDHSLTSLFVFLWTTLLSRDLESYWKSDRRALNGECALNVSAVHYTEQSFRFGMAEHAINTIYVLGDQPDALCSSILRDMSRRVFSTPQPTPRSDRAQSETGTSMQEDDNISDRQSEAAASDAHAADEAPPTPSSSQNPFSGSQHPGPAVPSFTVDPFQLGQLIFAAGHCAIKQLVHLELVEREYKRRKTEASKAAAKAASSKDGPHDELDQVVGSVEDDIADLMHDTKERELLYGEHALFSVLANMTVSICRYPKNYTVGSLEFAVVRRILC